MCMSSPSTPTPPPPPPPPPEAAKDTDPAIAKARQDERRRAQLAAGRQSTILTGGQGDTSDAKTMKKTLLGE